MCSSEMHNLDIFDVNNESMLGEEKNKDNITHEEAEETNTETKTNEKHDNSKSRRNQQLKKTNMLTSVSISTRYILVDKHK